MFATKTCPISQLVNPVALENFEKQDVLKNKKNANSWTNKKCMNK